MRLTRKQLLGALLAATGVAVIGVVLARRLPSQQSQTHAQHNDETRRQSPPAGYADAAVCASCHDQIASTFSLTGMGRSFSRPRSAGAWLADAAGGGRPDFKIRNRVYHEASDRYYTMVERDGSFYQRRHQIGFDGKESNSIEFEAEYVIGSGNHARTFLDRTADGRLIELPVSWYSERGPSTALRAGGFWAMSPGYDRPEHLDFRRVIDAGCMSCHNGYPRGAVEDDGTGPRFAEPLPEGIDCQRCHGPGQPHVDAIRAGDLEAGRRAIVNPANLDRDRQLEACMQCHLETTSRPLPFQIRRYEHRPFSYIPGKVLAEYFIHFDHATASGLDDKFEIAGGAYRLRKSACFQRSGMTCLTCHDPHDVPRGDKAVQHYVAICQSCHQGVHRGSMPQVQGARTGATCLDCHMPKRRTEDAVHVVMTDHYIQSRRVLGDLLAPRRESENFERGDYRGEVVLYYPPALPSTPENELYMALAQVQQGSNLPAGIPRLEHAIDKYKPQRADFYYELARAHSKMSNFDAVIRWSEEALRHDADFIPALKELAAAATATGRLAQAAEALEKAVTSKPADADALADLGNVYLQNNQIDEAKRALHRALTLDPNLPRANNTMGLAALKGNEMEAAEKYFRAAIRSQPDFAAAQNNLGNLLAGRKAYAEAAFHFEKAIRTDPNYVEARHSYGLVLALTREYAKAADQLRVAVRLAPRLAQAHMDLADVLAATGRTDEAKREYELAYQTTTDPELREAALAALRSLEGSK